MKRICVFSLILLSAAMAACNVDTTRTVVYTDADPNITVMPMETFTTPADTYSEYLASRRAEEESAANDVRQRVVIGDVSADTAASQFSAGSVGAVTALPYTDVTADSRIPEIPSADTSVPMSAPEIPEGNYSADMNVAGVGISLPETVRAEDISIERPAADTAVAGGIQAVTSPPVYTETAVNIINSDGGAG